MTTVIKISISKAKIAVLIFFHTTSVCLTGSGGGGLKRYLAESRLNSTFLGGDFQYMGFFCRYSLSIYSIFASFRISFTVSGGLGWLHFGEFQVNILPPTKVNFVNLDAELKFAIRKHWKVTRVIKINFTTTNISLLV